jgi:hypothetical protein
VPLTIAQPSSAVVAIHVVDRFGRRQSVGRHSAELARTLVSDMHCCERYPFTTEMTMRPYSKFFLLMTVFTAPSMGSCGLHGQDSGAKWPMASSTRAPAATGEVAVADGPNGNTRLTIRVRHLAPAQRIAPDATGYVAWVVPYNGSNQPESAGQQPQAGKQTNVGAIQLDSDLSGALNTVTPLRHFDVIVTPEASSSATQPSNPPVLSASIR